MILSFDSVSVELDAQRELRDLDWSVDAGGTCAVVGDARAHAVFADLVLGLRDPEDGEVRFAGKSWRALTPGARADRRARIGCALARPSWISNLDVDENLVLAERHRAGRDRTDVLAEAASLVERLGLPALPAARPHEVAPPALRQLAVVRALLGRRELLVLEDVETALGAAPGDALRDVVDERRAAGTAVLWLTATSAPTGRGATLDLAHHVRIRSSQT